MKNYKITILRAIFSILVGCLLVTFPDDTTKMLVIVIGLMFFIPGLVSILMTYAKPKTYVNGNVSGKSIPIIGIGSSILGLVLIIIPTTFISIMMYVLGAIFVVAGVYQIVEYRMCAKLISIPLFMYVIPVLVIMAGVFIFVNPIASASLPFIILGVSSIVYGVSEIVKAVKLSNANKIVEVEEPEMLEIDDKTKNEMDKAE